MNFQKLHVLYCAYRSSIGASREDAARAMYDEMDELRKRNHSIVIRSGGDDHDAQTVFDDAMLKTLRMDNLRDFGAAFLVNIKNTRIDFFRKQTRHRRRPTVPITEIYEDDDETAILPFILPADVDVEKQVLKKKEADKHSLNDFLLESAKILLGVKMTAIIETLRTDDDYAVSVNDAATSNGLQRNQLARPLQRLGRFYDPKVHGDIRDYFPDGVRIKREYLNAV